MKVFMDEPMQVSPTINVNISLADQPIKFTNANSSVPQYVDNWESYIGQKDMKRKLSVYIDEAMANNSPLPHVLLASGMPGAGKTTLARLIEKQMGGGLTMLVPPFSPETLYEAAMSVKPLGFLFIDEIGLLTPKAADNLLHLMEEGVLYLDDGIRKLHPMTVIGATTDPDLLPEPVLDRFMIKPYFAEYSTSDLVKITNNFCKYYKIKLLPETMVAIAKASRGTPRVTREFVIAAKALQSTLDRFVLADELLAFKEVTPDGLTKNHLAYLHTLFNLFGKYNMRSQETEYIAGEAALLACLRETKQGLSRLERYLLSLGLINRTPRGRALTVKGIARIQQN